MLMQWNGLIAALAVLGLNINAVWYGRPLGHRHELMLLRRYGALYRQRWLQLYGRAIRGWASWFYYEIL